MNIIRSSYRSPGYITLGKHNDPFDIRTKPKVYLDPDLEALAEAHEYSLIHIFDKYNPYQIKYLYKEDIFDLPKAESMQPEDVLLLREIIMLAYRISLRKEWAKLENRIDGAVNLLLANGYDVGLDARDFTDKYEDPKAFLVEPRTRAVKIALGTQRKLTITKIKVPNNNGV